MLQLEIIHFITILPENKMQQLEIIHFIIILLVGIMHHCDMVPDTILLLVTITSPSVQIQISSLLLDQTNSILEIGSMEVGEILELERVIQLTSSTQPEQVHSKIFVSHQVQLLGIFSPLMPLVMPHGKLLRIHHGDSLVMHELIPSHNSSELLMMLILYSRETISNHSVSLEPVAIL